METDILLYLLFWRVKKRCNFYRTVTIWNSDCERELIGREIKRR